MRKTLQKTLLSWYDRHKRVLPFRDTHDPYRIWVSEIMLQQTRTETVGPYFERLIERYPTVHGLAQAPLDEVLKLWEGLGYYSRARNLHRAAQRIAENGMPDDFETLQTLPGVGAYTAAAIASIAFGEPVPAMDGNLTRVIARLYHVAENAAMPSAKRKLFSLGQGLMPRDRPGDMNQALMDLGATICTPGTPDCERCPLTAFCEAHRLDDPETLPVLPVKTPPKVIPMGVAILTHGYEALVFRRKEALLNGLYVFWLLEGETEERKLRKALSERGVRVSGFESLGPARHVFTHRIWEMSVYHAVCAERPDLRGGLWVNLEQMKALAFPTAMKKAKEAAEKAIGDAAVQ